MLFKSKKIIGIDIGSSSIKVAEAELSAKGITLNSFAMVPTPANSIQNAEILDIGLVSEALKSALSQIGTNNKNVCIGINGPSVIVKKLSTAKISEKLMDQQIKWEAEQYIPFDINNVALDYHILKTSSSADTMDVLLVAAQNATLFQYAEAVQQIGLTNSIVDVGGFALANTFEFNYGRSPNEVIALINVGANITNFVVVQNSEVVFSRDLSVGGFNITTEIHKEMGVTIEEAEALKLSAVDKKEVPDEVHSIMSSVCEGIADEIKGNVDFFAATSNGATITKCFISGGSSKVTGLIEQIGRVTNCPVEILNPFLRTVVTSKKINPVYINSVSAFAPIVIGLAIRKMGDR